MRTALTGAGIRLTKCTNLQYSNHATDCNCIGSSEEFDKVWAGDNTRHDASPLVISDGHGHAAALPTLGRIQTVDDEQHGQM